MSAARIEEKLQFPCKFWLANLRQYDSENCIKHLSMMNVKKILPMYIEMWSTLRNHKKIIIVLQ